MTDEKRIEEMAKDIPYLTLDRTVFVSATETKNVSWMLSEEDNKVIAESLVTKGWVKPNEDSVVLTKEELKEKYVSIDLYKHLQKANKHTKEQLIEKDKMMFELVQEYHQVRKKTARKILSWVKKEIKELAIDKTAFPVFELGLLEQIAKLEGVEIEE